MIIEVRLFFNIAAPLFIQWRRRANSEHTLVGVEQEPWHRSCFVELIFCPRRALSTIPVFAMKCTLLLVEQFCFPSPPPPFQCWRGRSSTRSFGKKRTIHRRPLHSRFFTNVKTGVQGGTCNTNSELWGACILSQTPESPESKKCAQIKQTKNSQTKPGATPSHNSGARTVPTQCPRSAHAVPTTVPTTVPPIFYCISCTRVKTIKNPNLIVLTRVRDMQ